VPVRYRRGGDVAGLGVKRNGRLYGDKLLPILPRQEQSSVVIRGSGEVMTRGGEKEFQGGTLPVGSGNQL